MTTRVLTSCLKAILLLTSAICISSIGLAKAPPQSQATPSDALEERRLQIEERKAALEEKKLSRDSANDQQNFKLEERKLSWTAASIATPLILGVFAYFAQGLLQRRDQRLQLKLKTDNEALQFKLKAAEIAMNARDSNQVKAKAGILKALFKDELKGFEPEDFKPKGYAFSQSVESREKLLTLLAEHPASRKEIIQAWGILFPWDGDPTWKTKNQDAKDKHRWLDNLKNDSLVNKNRIDQPNESQSKADPPLA